MNSADLLALLALLVNANRLTADDARALVSAFDAGTLGPDSIPAGPLVGQALAVLFAAAVQAGRMRAARAFAAQYSSRIPTGPKSVAGALRALDSRPLRERVRLIDSVRANDVRGALSREAERRTAVLFATEETAKLGGVAGTAHRAAGSVDVWQRAMQQAYAEDAATLARLGAGGELSLAQTQRLAAIVADKAAYVDRFAVRLAQDRAGLTEKPLSEAQIRAAMVRNTGEARTLFYENAGDAETRDMDAPVYTYVALDTPATCGPCSDAAAGSPYLVGDGPLPGSICLGSGYCRCEVSYRSDPEAYARLSA